MFSNIHNDRCAWIQQHLYVLPLSWQRSLVLLLSLGTVLLLRVTIPFTFLFGIFNLLIINICLLSRFCDALLIIHLKLLGTFFLVVVRSFFFPHMLLHCHFVFEKYFLLIILKKYFYVLSSIGRCANANKINDKILSNFTFMNMKLKENSVENQ